MILQEEAGQHRWLREAALITAAAKLTDAASTVHVSVLVSAREDVIPCLGAVVFAAE